MLDLFVAGVPMPQGSKTPVVRGGRAVLLEGRRGPARAAFTAWRKAVRDAATTAMAGAAPLEGPIELEARFYLRKPTSAPRGVLWADKRPDGDKLVRAVADAITGVAFVDDGQVVDWRVLKVYAVDARDGRTPLATGVRIRVRPARELLLAQTHRNA